MLTELGYRKLKSMVYRVLERVEETRDSDITLMIRICEIYYPSKVRHDKSGEAEIFLKDLYELPREDNIKRIRAFFQNEQNLFLPKSEIVRKNRGISEERWKKWLEYQFRTYRSVEPVREEQSQQPLL